MSARKNDTVSVDACNPTDKGNTTKTADNYDPAEMVTVRIPRMKDDNSDVYVSVNDRTWLIQRGKEVEIPRCVAEVLEHSDDMEEEAYKYSKAAQKN